MNDGDFCHFTKVDTIDSVKCTSKKRTTIKEYSEYDESSIIKSIKKGSKPFQPSTSILTISEEKKKGKMWSTDEIMVYYEAVKQLGKDFDGIVKTMQKKKVYKDKDQIRNFFFNCVKFLRNLCDIHVDELFPNVCRDAKELFFVINACEWRKRTGAAKYQPDRMKELILDGVTMIKANKKSIAIKTPCCPALQRYFTEFHMPTNDKLLEIMITLSPETYVDKAYVISCEQNPYISFKISTNERLIRIFDFLASKWKLKTNNVNNRLNIVLRPEQCMEQGKITFLTTDTFGDTISLSELEKDHFNRQMGDTEISSDTNNEKKTCKKRCIKRQLFSADETRFDELTAENVGESSVADLYCLSGFSTNCKLLYSIKTMRNKTETWKVFQELIVREYSEQLSSTNREEEKNNFKISVEDQQSPAQPLNVQLKKEKRSISNMSACPSPMSQGSTKEKEDICRFKEQLQKFASVKKRPTRTSYNSFEPTAKGRFFATEPTDFSQMTVSSAPSSSMHLFCSSDNMDEQTREHQESMYIKDANHGSNSKKDGTHSSLCSNSMQNIVHKTMKEILRQDSNHAISAFSGLLEDFEQCTN